MANDVDITIRQHGRRRILRYVSLMQGPGWDAPLGYVPERPPGLRESSAGYQGTCASHENLT